MSLQGKRRARPGAAAEPCAGNVLAAADPSEDEGEGEQLPQHRPDAQAQRVRAAPDEEAMRLAGQHVARGERAAEAGHWTEALGAWDAALRCAANAGPADEWTAKVHEYRAQALAEAGSDWPAVQAAQRATEHAPQWARAWRTLARCQMGLGEPSMALDSARRAARLWQAQGGAHEAQQQMATDVSWIEVSDEEGGTVKCGGSSVPSHAPFLAPWLHVA